MRLSVLLRTVAVVAAVSFTAAPAFAQTVPSIRVTVAPPAMRVEERPAAPSATHVWIPGHWVWREGQHVWASGHWVLAPNGYTWEHSRWVLENGAWSFYEGHWRHVAPPAPTVVYQPVAPAQPVVVQVAPPPPIVEVRTAPPTPTHVWIPGYWHWHGNHHFWVVGRWSAPNRGHVWEPHRWERDGAHWRFVHGHWRK
jgi:hypothetical protein